uniref:Uncharacterized protein n=1 Tax=Methylophaga nitratireducenticrescens TaxID=754476 RepID=I1XFQ1_METNJ
MVPGVQIQPINTTHFSITCLGVSNLSVFLGQYLVAQPLRSVFVVNAELKISFLGNIGG